MNPSLFPLTSSVLVNSVAIVSIVVFELDGITLWAVIGVAVLLNFIAMIAIYLYGSYRSARNNTATTKKPRTRKS